MVEKSILIVEDDDSTANQLKLWVNQLGYEVMGIANSGERALELLDRRTPNVVVMDIGLPGDLDGIATAERIQARWSPAIVYATAYADDLTLERAARTKPVAYLVKPFDHYDLKPVLKLALYPQPGVKQIGLHERVTPEEVRALLEPMRQPKKKRRIRLKHR